MGSETMGTTAARDRRQAERAKAVPKQPYGRFSPDGAEFRITNPRTPRPWANIISNPRLGLAVTQSGSGFTWIDNSQLAVITRWRQELAEDTSGKFLYVRDANSGAVWSLAPAPMWPAYSHYVCRHGLGYTVFVTEFDGIRADWTVFCDAERTAELWRVELQNVSGRERRLELCAYLEWCCGVTPDPRREFHKLFIENWFDAQRSAVFATSHMWDVPSERYGHWNTSFPYVAAFGSSQPVEDAEGEKSAFFGNYSSVKEPQALGQANWPGVFGRHGDPIAALRSTVALRPGARRVMGYALAVGSDRASAEQLVGEMANVEAIDASLETAKQSWRDRLAHGRVDTPDETVNVLANDWLRYQAISARIWGRCGYYQQSGAYGFRDQMQDSQVWATIEPPRFREQILLHSRHQHADGSVLHWWHPLTEQGLVTRFSDDLLWLGFMTARYLKQTGDFDILHAATPFVDDATEAPLSEHIERMFARVFGRMSPRGLPYIGAGDWNDGLSAVGLQEKGESVWLGHFLAGLLADWAEVYRRTGHAERADEFDRRREALIAAINEHAWDGQWYMRATLDDGTKLGSAENRVGRIFLNAQTWAILNDVAPPERAQACMAAVKEHLVTEAGPLLLAPAFDTPEPRVGYITRYAPGLRENGGVYTHAACWAIAAACKAGDRQLASDLLDAINPAKRDSDRYWAEPYVLPGNIDGPASPHFGRGGWTWYTGSAGWLQNVINEWILGVRPEWAGLRIAPCLPPGWSRASFRRMFRGSEYRIDIECAGTNEGRCTVTLDGQPLPDNLIPAPAGQGEQHVVHVNC